MLESTLEVSLVILLTVIYIISFMFHWIFPLSIATIHIVIVPLVFKYSYTFQRHLIFLNLVRWPLKIDFDRPEASGIVGARNLYVEFVSKIAQRKIRIGVWHVLPKSSHETLKATLDKQIDVDTLFEEELRNSKKPIILYCHGNSNTRSAQHRIRLYQVLRDLEFHVIALDYRGYGDSTRIDPTEMSAVEDTLQVYAWLVSRFEGASTKPRIFVWGHSLGTGITSHVFGNLESLSESLMGKRLSSMPNGLILEAPFNNLSDEVANHPFTILVRFLPYFKLTFAKPFAVNDDFRFESDLHLTRVPKLPLIILHAKDDWVIPYRLAKKLYRSVQDSRGVDAAPVAMHGFESKLGLGHKWICNAPNLGSILNEFIAAHS